MFDFLFKRATIIDGTGSPRFEGDAAVANGMIQAVDAEIKGEARHTVEAKGLVLTPGFTDIHGHSDLHILDFPEAEIKLRQGVTLDVAGNCGFSVVPLCTSRANQALEGLFTLLGKPDSPIEFKELDEYALTLKKNGISTNLAMLTGHSTLRTLAMGFSNQPPNNEQLAKMKRLLARELELGSLGLSSGLIYLPGCYSATGELISLAEVLRQKGGVYVSHIRNESDLVVESILEALHIGREAKVPVHISHLKVCGARNWPLAEKIVTILEEARSQGIEVTCDVYPYTSASTTLMATLPPWALEGGVPVITERLRDKETRRQMVRETKTGLEGWHNFYIDAGWSKTRVASVKNQENKFMEGRTIADLADEAGQDPFEFAYDLLVAEDGAVFAVYELMNRQIMEMFLSLPFAMVGSDGAPVGSKPHPRLYGTFPRVIRMAREKGLFSLEQAVRKMTSQPNQRLGIGKRGLLKPGYWADLTLFDPEVFSDTATYDTPRNYPVGLKMVLVNGRVVIENEKHTGEAAGEFIFPER